MVSFASHGARRERDNEKALVRALYVQRRDEGLCYLRGATLIVALSLALFVRDDDDLSCVPVRCVDAHPAYLRHRAMPHCIGRFLRLTASELVRAAQIRPRLSLCPGSLLDACRLLLSVNADHQTLCRCLAKIMTRSSAPCQGHQLLCKLHNESAGTLQSSRDSIDTMMDGIEKGRACLRRRVICQNAVAP